jgi:hypothetical protein
MMLALMASGLSAAQSQAQTVSGSERFDRYWQEDGSSAGPLYECRLYAADLTAGEAAQCAEYEASYAASEPEEPVDLRYALLAAIMDGGGEGAIIDRFAASLAVTPDEARLAVDLMLDTKAFSDACENQYRGCAWAPDSPLPELWVRAGRTPLIAALFRELGESSSFKINAARLPLEWRDSTATRQFLIERYLGSQDFRLFIVATRDLNLSADLLQTVFTRVGQGVSWEDQFAYLDWLFRQMSAEERLHDSGLLVTALRMREALRLDFGAEAVSVYSSLPQSAQTRMWALASGAPQDPSEAQRARQQVFELQVWLAAAEIAQGNASGALELLDQADAVAVFTEEDRQVAEVFASSSRYPNLRTRIASPGDAEMARFLRQQMAPDLTPAERYGMFIAGTPDGTLSDSGDIRHGASTAGWLWPVLAATPEIRRLAIDYLDTPATLAVRDYLEREGARRQNRREAGNALEFDDASFMAIRDSIRINSEAPTESTEPMQASASRLNIFRERALSSNMTSQPMRGFAEPATLPAGLPEMPVDAWQVARLERRGDVWDLIYTSQELDPTGEISAGGYWYVQSEADGGGWQVPIYLGLQQFFPYVVLPGSSLPLVEGDRLQIAVAVREIDPDSITFPPIGLRARREADDLVIEANFSELLRDQDGDGLTDIFEHRIGLDPLDPDSDGDGFEDGIDGLPLTEFDPARIQQGDLGRILLEQVFGYDAGAIRLPLSTPANGLLDILSTAMAGHSIPAPARSTLIMRGNPDLFAGLMTRERIIVLDDAALARISPEYGVLYPVGMSTILPNADASQVYVIWSADWVGGEFYVWRNEAGEYEVKVTSSWIT